VTRHGTTVECGRALPKPLRLHYAERDRRSRRWVWRSIAVLVVLGTGASAVYFRKTIWAQARLLYWQRQCMNYGQPPGHVACEAVGADAPASEKAARDARFSRTGYTGSVGFVEYVPDPLKHFDPDFDRPPLFNSWFQSVCLFLHERRSPAGHDRLVQVVISSDLGFASIPAFTAVFSLSGTSIIPASVVSRPHPLPLGSGALDVTWKTGRWNDRSFFRFFTGRPDPVDSSHFTIDYEVGNAVHLSVLANRVSPPPRGGKVVGNEWSLNDPPEPPTSLPVAR
jgi:hypothetical protein